MSAPKPTTWHVYHTTEAKGPWCLIHDRPEERAKAIAAGAMFFSQPSLSAPYDPTGPEPRRRGPLVIDLDGDNLGMVQKEALRILAHLEEVYNLDSNDVELYVSGQKGLHLLLSPVLFGVDPHGEEFLPLVYKRLVSQWVTQLGLQFVDMSLFCMKSGKMLRTANVQRGNGRYKVPITFDELVEMLPEELEALTRQPRLAFQPAKERPYRANGTLAEVYAHLLELVREELKARAEAPPLSDEQRAKLAASIPPCIKAIIATCPPKNERVNFNRLILLLGTYFHAANADAQTALAAVEPFLERYPHSASYDTPAKRREAWLSMWKYLDGNESYAWGCEYVKGLHLPGNAFECKTCPANPEASPFTPPSEEELAVRAKAVLDTTTPCGSFDTEALPPILRRFVDEQLGTTETEPIMLTMALLGALSGCFRKRLCIPEGAYFQKLYPVLWMVAISQSGSFKTTALRKGGRLIYRKAREISDQARAVQAFADEAPPTTDLKSKKDLAAQAEREAKVRVIRRQNPLLPNRMSAEGLIDILTDGGGGALFASELGELLAALEQGHNATLKPMLTDFYDVPSSYTYRTMKHGHKEVAEPFVSIVGVSTLQWLERNLNAENDVASGFFARFLLFYPPQKKTIPPALPAGGVASNTSAEAEIMRVVNEIPPTSYGLTPEARELFETFHQSIYRAIYSMPETRASEILEPYLKRWSPSLLKVAMLFQPFLDKEATSIGVEALAAAIPIIEYAIRSTAHLFKNELGESEFQRKCRVVLSYTAKKGGTVKRSALLASRILVGGIREYEEVLDHLHQSGALGKTGDAAATITYTLEAKNVQ